MDQIKKCIKQLGGKDKIAELNLASAKIGKFTKEMSAAIQQCKHLEILILTQCQLQSLEDLPRLKSLQGLDASNNKLKDDDIKHIIKKFPNLMQLMLADNKVEKVESIKALKELKKLTDLDLSQNPVSADPQYRKVAFEEISTLNSLDGRDQAGNEIEEEAEFDDDEQEEFQGDDEDQDDYDEDQEDSEDQKPKKKRK